MSKTREPIVLENVQVIFRKLGSGVPESGNSGFEVLLDKKTADYLLRDGMKVRYLPAKPSDPPRQAVLGVSILHLEKLQNLHLLKNTDAMRVDLVIDPYSWEVAGRTGIKAYLLEVRVHRNNIVPD